MLHTRTYLIDRLGVVRSDSILTYLKENNCKLTICKPRKTKLGDFRVRGEQKQIKVNQGMNQYRFVLTLVHEIAHLKTFIEFRNSVAPHGKQWKENYRQLMQLWNIKALFSNSADLITVFNNEWNAPKACAGIHTETELKLRQYDEGAEGVMLQDLGAHALFDFKGVRYEKLQNRRSRVLCKRLDDQRLYTIHKASWVVEL